MKEITCDELKSLPEDSYVLIDIRDEGLREYGMIPGAVSVPTEIVPFNICAMFLVMARPKPEPP